MIPSQHVRVFCLLICGIMGIQSPAAAQWSESFDGYVPGDICQQSAWDPVLRIPETCGHIVADQFRSPPYALSVRDDVGEGDGEGQDFRLRFASDVPGLDPGCGVWQFTCWVYVPAEATDEYYIILNSTTVPLWEWGVQIRLNAELDHVLFCYPGSDCAPLIRDEWVEVAAIIDLNDSTVDVYYDNVLLVEDSVWLFRPERFGDNSILGVNVVAEGFTGGQRVPMYVDDMDLVNISSEGDCLYQSHCGGAESCVAGECIADEVPCVNEQQVCDESGQACLAAQCVTSDSDSVLADNAAPEDRFGTAVDLADGLAAVGSVGRNSLAGAAYVYRQGAAGWTLAEELSLPEGTPGDQFGQSVLINGASVFIGAPGRTMHDNFRGGAVYEFRQTDSGWTPVGTMVLQLGDPLYENAGIGHDLAVSEDTLAAGGIQAGDGAGSIALFTRTGDDWAVEQVLSGPLDLPENQRPHYADELFGFSVAMDGDHLAGSAVRGDTIPVPAPLDTPRYTAVYEAGAVYTYHRVDGVWTLGQRLMSPEPSTDGAFGFDISLSGDFLAVSDAYSEKAEGQTLGKGAVRIYRFVDDAWTLHQSLLASDPLPGGGFGFSVHLEDGVLLVGAAGANEGLGAVYVFELVGEVFVQRAKLLPHADFSEPGGFGASDINRDGAQIIVGAPYDSTQGEFAGAVHLFAGVSDCDANGVLDVCDMTFDPSVDGNGDGVVDACGGACCLEGECQDVALDAACTGFVCDVRANMLPECGGACHTMCFGDVNGDGVVSPADRGFVSANIGESDPAVICQYDLNGDGVITPQDRGFVSANVGTCTALPDFQNGSGLSNGLPDERFGAAVFQGAGTTCLEASCP